MRGFGLATIVLSLVLNPWVAELCFGAWGIERRDALQHAFALLLPLGFVLLAVGSPRCRGKGIVLGLAGLLWVDRLLLVGLGMPLWVGDAELGHRHRPNQVGAGVTTNALGFHDDAFPATKRVGELRGLLLGGSVTLGEGLPVADTAASQLERLLAQVDTEYGAYHWHQVVNAGVRGYSTSNAAEVLEASLDLEPDFVAYGLSMGVVAARLRGASPGAQAPGWFRSATGFGRLKEMLAGAEESPRTSGEIASSLSDPRSTPEAAAAWDTLLAELAELYEVANREALPIALLLLPSRFQLDDAATRAPQRILAEHAASHGVEVVDVAHALASRAADAFLDVEHLSARGQGVVARALLEQIVSRGLVRDGRVSRASGGAGLDVAPTHPGQERPNIVLVVTDDQGCGDFSLTGNDRLSTPNIDKLASEGTYFTSFHVSPVCAPTRAALMTGKYHNRTGVRGVVGGREYMADEEVTVAELLKEAGYRTALFGKWHLGEHYPSLPGPQGFDEFVGFRAGGIGYFDAQLEDAEGKPYPTKGYLTDVLTDLGIEFTEKGEDPFFLYLAYNAVHSPLHVPEAYAAPYGDLHAGTAAIFGMAHSLDENLGRLFRHLDETGLARDTVVFFMSDNGPLTKRAPRFNCGLRGQKYDVYQGGVKVPMIVRAKGRVPAGKRVSENTAHVDLLPTILSYAGVAVPEGLDGRGLRAAIEGRDPALAERPIFLHYPGEYPLSEPRPKAPYPGGSLLTGRYKMVDGRELYDIVADPGETTNLASAEPERLASMDRAFRAWYRVASRERPNAMPVQIGHSNENPVALDAHIARVEGSLGYGYRPNDPDKVRKIGVHGDYLGRWTDEGDTATWHAEFVAGGRYRVVFDRRCRAGDAGATMRVTVGGAVLEGTVTGCSADGMAFEHQKVGEIAVEAGLQTITVEALSIPGERAMDLAHLVFEQV